MTGTPHIDEAALEAAGMHIEELRTELPERTFTPRMRLLVEVLRQALVDLEDDTALVREHARAWFDGDGFVLDGEPADDRDDIRISFAMVCDELHLDAVNIGTAAFDATRRRVILERLRREWREAGSKAGDNGARR